MFSGGGPISGFTPDFTWWGQGRIFSVPVPVIIFFAAAIAAHIVLKHTRFGMHIYAVSARLNSAEAVAGMGLELDVIAAVVIGGTSLFGGVGSVFGTVVGALLIGGLRNGLVLMGVSSFIQQIVIGLILIAAVAFDQYAASRSRA